MNAFVGVVIRLLSNLIEMPQVFVTKVIGANPVSALLIGVGTAFVLAAVGAFGYAVLGALGISRPSLGRGPTEN